jgi:hypothetical protein
MARSETALRAETAADLAYYDEDSVAGRLRPGVIRSGDIYALESWQESVEVVEIRGSNLSPALQAALREQRVVLDSAKIYTVAATGYAAGELQRKYGGAGRRKTGTMLRDLTVAYLRSHGLPNLQS